MGNCCLPLRFHRISSAISSKTVTLLLLGLDKSGKTTIAKRLANEPIDSVVPTVGFSVLNLRQKGCKITLYDLGGGPQIRGIWHRYYADAHGVIFVVDASAIDRMDECHQVLKNLLQHDQISGKPVLLLANKQDLDGALDEIDIVDRLNLERIVNEQKCPTLVELCSALYFSKKIDIGIDNGYKWLVRGIVRNYPSLHNRVLKDLAQQEEENRVLLIKHRKENGEGMKDNGITVQNKHENSFIRPKTVIKNKNHVNGLAKCKVKSLPQIPGFVDDRLLETSRGGGHCPTQKFFDGRTESARESRSTSHSSEFFLLEKYQSDMELLKEVSNHSFKNFLVRPKSSGARLYGIKSDKRKRARRKHLIRSNKTGPSPFTNLAENQKTAVQRTSSETMQKPSESNSILPQIFFPPSSPSSFPFSTENIQTFSNQTLQSSETINAKENGKRNRRESVKGVPESGNPFLVTPRVHKENEPMGQELKIFWESEFRTKSTPNSRKNSGNVENAYRRRHSSTDSKLSKTEGLLPLKVNNRLNSPKEILLDVTQLNRDFFLKR